jgi:uncharacterized integral membrane protein
MSDTRPREDTSRRIDKRHVLTATAAILLLWFVVSNWQSVRIHFWVTSTRAPLFIVIVLAAALGGAVGWFLNRYRRAPSGKRAPSDK